MILKRKRRRQRGSSLAESIFCIFLLLLVFGSMLQIFQWISRQMIFDYAAFYGAKSLALGYAGENCRQSVRIAAAGGSGRDISTGGTAVPLSTQSRLRLRTQAERYLTMGEGSGVNYQYWKQSGGDSRGYLNIWLDPRNEFVECTATLSRPDLLIEPMGKIMSVTTGGVPEAKGEQTMYNYAALWLDE